MYQSATKQFVFECGAFSGGIVSEGTECIVVLKKSGEEVLKIAVLSSIPTEDLMSLVKSTSGISEIPMEEINIFVYAICRGARGRDI